MDLILSSPSLDPSPWCCLNTCSYITGYQGYVVLNVKGVICLYFHVIFLKSHYEKLSLYQSQIK